MTQLDIYFVLQPEPSSPKKRKIDVKGDESSSLKENIQFSPITPLTLPVNSLLVNVGPSWFKALESEFSKQYFIDVSAFHPS